MTAHIPFNYNLIKICSHCGLAFGPTYSKSGYRERPGDFRERRWCSTDCCNQSQDAYKPAPLPTPDEIEQRAREIRATWPSSRLYTVYTIPTVKFP